MFKFTLLDFASTFDEAPSISIFNFFCYKTNNRLLVFIFLIALLDGSLEF